MKQFRILAFLPIEDVIPIYEEYVSSLSDELIDDLSQGCPPFHVANHISAINNFRIMDLNKVP